MLDSRIKILSVVVARNRKWQHEGTVMSHDEAVRSFAVEKYLLEELSVESRDELKNIYSIVRSVPWIFESEQPSSC